MAKEDDTLMGLFSTRASDERKKVVKANSSELSLPSTSSPAETSLTPIANKVLKEARRELGNSDEGIEIKDGEVSEDQIAAAVDKVCAENALQIDDIARADIIVHLKQDLMGWGVLQPLVDNPEVTDIHCYDYQSVILQRGKMSEATGIRWPSPEAYATFIDRILFRLGKSLSTQQHTCLLYTSPSPRDQRGSRMPSSA